MKEIILLKGTSGAGKSSRVYVFYKFLVDIVCLKPEVVSIYNPEGKEKPIGFHFAELNDLLIIGKLFKSGDVERFQGYDNITSTFGSSAGFSKWLKLNKDRYSPLVEGAGVTRTNRLRPYFLFHQVGYKNIFMQYYNFTQDQKRDYLDRIVGRSGKEPGEQMWSKNIEFVREVEMCRNEKQQIKGEGHFSSRIAVCEDPYDQSIDDFGSKLILCFYPQLNVEEFMEYCELINYTEQNKHENFQ